MNQLSRRVWLTAILMGCSWVFTVWVRSGYTFDIQPLSNGLDSLPMELDGYVGTDLPLDEGVSAILNADATVNRSYRRPDGSSVTIHASAWVRPENVSTVAPHSPKICYTNSGWVILEERPAEIETPTGKLPVRILLLERNEDRCVVTYWYQMGKSIFTTAGEARQVHRSLWGKKHWPATLKFMLQMPGREIDSTIPKIEEFASTVFEWSLKL